MRTAIVMMLTAAWVMGAQCAIAAEANPGRAAYLRYCSSCHGPDGKGDGIVAPLMNPRPADLTQLAKSHDGKFPSLQVQKSIDGRQRIAAHGTSEMPVWGEVFTAEKASTQPDAVVRGQVQLLADYLSTIQAP